MYTTHTCKAHVNKMLRLYRYINVSVCVCVVCVRAVCVVSVYIHVHKHVCVHLSVCLSVVHVLMHTSWLLQMANHVDSRNHFQTDCV